MLTHVKHSAKINLMWMAGNGPLREAIWEKVTKRVATAFDEMEDDPFFLPDFPYQWAFGDQDDNDGLNGPLPDDPLTIYITLPLADMDDDELPYWSFSINDSVDDLIDGSILGDGKIHDPSPGIIAVRDALRAAAQRIDDAIAKEEDR